MDDAGLFRVYVPKSLGGPESDIQNSGKSIEVNSLDLEGEPDEILSEIDRIAARVKNHATGGDNALEPGTGILMVAHSFKHRRRRQSPPRR